MRIVIQRVKKARVEVNGEITGSIDAGLLLLVGISKSDTPKEADYLAAKVVGLRIFQDEEGKMNRDILEAGGSVLIVSQFTLYGDCRKGRRPSFDDAAGAGEARVRYEYFVAAISALGVPVQTGVFQASMDVHLVNDGPVTLICESTP